MTSPSVAGRPAPLGEQRPRICLVPDGPYLETARVAIEVCELAGLSLDEWQRWYLMASLAEREDGKWAAGECGLVVPRQNGKGSIEEGRELTGLFAIDEERLIIHSAHEQATSSEHQRRLLDLIEAVPEFDQKVLRAPRGKGMEAIELRDGSRILFKTRTGGGGRGLTGDLVVFDEAMILPEGAVGALAPTMAARSMFGNPQLWYAGSSVDQENSSHDGVVLSRVRSRALRGVPRLLYAEWSVEGDDPSQVPESVRRDPRSWGQANPGKGIRIAEEHIAAECDGLLGVRTFVVERLGVGDWPDPSGSGEQIIADADWDALTDPASKRAGAVCFAFDVTPDRKHAAIAVGGHRADGLEHVEIVEHRPGTSWVVPRLIELRDKHWPEAILGDEKDPLVEDARKADLEIETVGGADHARACAGLVAAVDDATFRHLGTPEVKAALRGAAKRSLVDGWAWSRKSSAVDISPLVALTVALRKAELMGDGEALVTFSPDELAEVWRG
jgi:hypothetical protein